METTRRGLFGLVAGAMAAGGACVGGATGGPSTGKPERILSLKSDGDDRIICGVAVMDFEPDRISLRVTDERFWEDGPICHDGRTFFEHGVDHYAELVAKHLRKQKALRG